MYAGTYGKGTLLNVWIQPKAAKTSFVGIYGDSIKIAVKSPPVDGKANDECLRYLAELLQFPKSAFSIKTGHKGRRKRIYVDGITPEKIISELGSKVDYSS